MSSATPHDEIRSFYARTGVMTDLGSYRETLGDLPAEASALVEVVQGLLLHVFWAERYGVHLSEGRQGEIQLRALPRKLERLFEIDPAPLTEARPLERRLVGNCRDFAVVLAALLQHQGVPARARCGFGIYFMPNHHEDHWITEYWRADEGRWVLVDAQLDALQRDVLKIPFDPLDLPRDQFVMGGQAWQRCCAGEADPNAFGIFDMHGLWFVRGNAVRDYLAMNKVEILPWDGWGLMTGAESAHTEDLDLMHEIARLPSAGDEAFAPLRTLYQTEPRLYQVPEELANAWPDTAHGQSS